VATDKLIYEYTTRFPNVVAKFVQAETDDYEAKSLTFKEIEKRADIFLIGRSGQHVVLLETQGYEDEELLYSMIKKIMLYCTHNKYWGSMDAVAIFLEEAHFRAANERFERQFGQSSLLRFTPKVFVFSRIKVDELSRLNDVHLIPLYPLCDISPQEIERQAPQWAEQIKKAPDVKEEERKNLLSFLGGAISHRIKTITQEEISTLFGGFVMEDTPVVQEIVQRVEKRGIAKGIQQVLLEQIAARFGVVPEEIRQKIQAINDTDNLKRIATLLLTIQSVDELKDLVN
jgi:predicted transposase YdaD